jgi:small-conductance mechanosensitive channel
VSYNSDLEEVERVTIEVAREVMQTVTGGVPEFEPFIRFQEFKDFHISFAVFLRVMEFFDQGLVKHEFIKKLHKRYREEGIEIPYPSQNLYVKQVLRKKSPNSLS